MNKEKEFETIDSATQAKKNINYCLHCGKPFESLESFQEHQKGLVEIGPNQSIINLRYQPYFQQEPAMKEQFYQAAVSSDHVTITSWWDTWLKHIEANSKRYDIHKNSLMNEFGKWAYKPAICAGSGPSLRKNSIYLKPDEKPGVLNPFHGTKTAWPGRGDVGMISCLHNFAYFEDNGTPADYYVNLDAGDITIRDMTTGGNHDGDPDHYWKLTENRTLVTALVGHPDLLKKWRGPILFFSTMIPDQKFLAAHRTATKNFNIMVSTGGNALGASFYIARAILGASPIVFIGANFAFDYDERFYAFESENQKFSGLVWVTDVFGNKVATWPSYRNFAQWFSYMSAGGKGNNPMTLINCTEGGIMGAYDNGNISTIKQEPLRTFLFEHHSHKLLPEMVENKDMYNFLF